MPTTPSFTDECNELIHKVRDSQSCLDLFQLSFGFNKTQLLSAYRKLALKYHPDKNPLDKEAAEKATILINRAKNHLLTGEPFVNPYLPALAPKAAQSLKTVDFNELLEEIEMISFRIESEYHFPDLIKELKRRILENPNYLLYTTDAGERTPLRLAIELGDFELFRWLLSQGDNQLLTAGTVCWCPLHFLLFKANKPMLDHLASLPQYGRDWLNKQYLYIIANRKQGPTDILNNCVAFLQQQNIAIPTSIEDNPFLINTPIGAHLQGETLLGFFKTKIKKYPELYYLLPEDQKTESYFILSQHQLLLNSSPVDAHLSFCSLALTELSPYFISVLLDDLYPKIKASAHLYNMSERLNLNKIMDLHRFTYRSLTKEHHLCVLACITLLGIGVAIACACPAITIPGAAYALAVALVPFLFLEAHALYGLYRKSTEKTKIMRILTENNFFQTPAEVPPTAEVKDCDYDSALP